MTTRKEGTVGALKETGYRPRSVRDEMRENMIRALKSGDELFPGIIGYERSVQPQIANAVLSRHNIIFLGLRGQAKTRLARQLTAFLDPEVPILKGFPLNEDPLAPVTSDAKKLLAEAGEDAEIEWLPREKRYSEKLATPDVTMADLIGDIDPIKAANLRLDYASEGVIHYGIIPRTNRGIFCINELPDLAGRIQVGLLNIMEERDIQIRGFPVRLPMDVMMIFTANPEDYTNRGSIITPLKDRIASQIMTHYPTEVGEALEITGQEAWRSRESEIQVHVPPWIEEAIEETAFAARKSEFLDQTSGVSARLPITLLENVTSNAERRGLLNNEQTVCVRPIDLQSAISAVTGKVELVYEGEQEGAMNVARHLIGRGLKNVFDRTCPEAKSEGQEENAAFGPYREIIDWFAKGGTIEIEDMAPAAEVLKTLSGIPGLADLAEQHVPMEQPKLETAAAMEFVLEGLHQASMLAKDDAETGAVYRDMLGSMFEGVELGEGPGRRRKRRRRDEW